MGHRRVIKADQRKFAPDFNAEPFRFILHTHRHQIADGEDRRRLFIRRKVQEIGQRINSALLALFAAIHILLAQRQPRLMQAFDISGEAVRPCGFDGEHR